MGRTIFTFFSRAKAESQLRAQGGRMTVMRPPRHHPAFTLPCLPMSYMTHGVGGVARQTCLKRYSHSILGAQLHQTPDTQIYALYMYWYSQYSMHATIARYVWCVGCCVPFLKGEFRDSGRLPAALSTWFSEIDRWMRPCMHAARTHPLPACCGRPSSPWVHCDAHRPGWRPCLASLATPAFRVALVA